MSESKCPKCGEPLNIYGVCFCAKKPTGHAPDEVTPGYALEENIGAESISLKGLKDEIDRLAEENKRLKDYIASVKEMVDHQANDESLWMDADSVVEAYVQQELRRLHEVIEVHPATVTIGADDRPITGDENHLTQTIARLVDDVNNYRHKIDRLTDRLATAKGLIKKHQWAGIVDCNNHRHSFCPECLGLSSPSDCQWVSNYYNTGHKTDCKLAAFLKDVSEAKERE